MRGIIAIILAAGSASRMKGIKQVLPFKSTTLLGNTISQAQSSKVDEVIAILGANFNEVKRKIIHEDIIIVENKSWKNGLGSSIAAGVKYIIGKGKNPEAVLVILGDQPLIDAGYLNKMIDTFLYDSSKIVATNYKKHFGVPAIFPAAYFTKLAGLNQDFGAKHILNDPQSEVIALNAGNKTVDIDTPEDYKAVISGMKSV